MQGPRLRHRRGRARAAGRAGGRGGGDPRPPAAAAARCATASTIRRSSAPRRARNSPPMLRGLRRADRHRRRQRHRDRPHQHPAGDACSRCAAPSRRSASTPEIALVDGNVPPPLPCPVHDRDRRRRPVAVDRRRLGHRQGDARPADARASRCAMPAMAGRPMSATARASTRRRCRRWASRRITGAPSRRSSSAFGFECERIRSNRTDSTKFIDDATRPGAKCGRESGGITRMGEVVAPARRRSAGRAIASSAMAQLPEASVDLVFADPPYNLQLGGELHRPNNSRVDGVEEDWDKFADFADYDRFTRAWLGRGAPRPEARRHALGDRQLSQHLPRRRDRCRIWASGSSTTSSGARPTRCRISAAGASPTRMRRCCGARASREARYTFNYEAMKALNDDLQMRSDWLHPALRRPRAAEGGDGKKAHPTQKPEALLHRVLLASTQPGDIVLDPFFGTGTTGAVAQAARPALHRHRARTRTTPRVARRAHRRGHAGAARRRRRTTPGKRDEPRIPFGSAGRARPAQARRRAVRRDAALDRQGARRRHARSRPSAAARSTRSAPQVQGAPACNGWAFWHFLHKGQPVSIDVLRQRVRAELGARQPA